MKKILPGISALYALALVGCSSPPEPAAVDFDQTPKVVNNNLPRLVMTNEVIKSQESSGPWSLTLADFQGDQRPYNIDFYYALDHADLIELDTPSLGDAQRTRKWLIEHGATAPIQASNKAKPVQPISRTWRHETTGSSFTYRATALCAECENVAITLHKYAEVTK
ncbi:hypothetical protein Pfra02_44570 [Pseudomonas fragi]|nr:hypothetical protein Pfra02_44570 [Pseudomonas fragi]